ncbi:hypothetical protein [Rhodococcus sp. IEGM 1330]|uniref:hypothetical protein n=1 Tax=Rhodococcus sp. IEGM 1330 TaxID=3082225 RepID=UPI0029530BF0|nr:hypothetical protein [Rhodococcus sp. IEGM 1330]MDV8023683.1 hypothetical protein [Rhodococcus sp. IEGM 1330]
MMDAVAMHRHTFPFTRRTRRGASTSQCLTTAAPATAEQEDVTFTAKSGGNSITGTFSFAGGRAPHVHVPRFRHLDAITQTFAVYGLVYPDADSTSVSLTDLDVAEKEHTLDWSCSGSGEQWGTEVHGGSAAVPVTVVAPADEPDPVCTGSVSTDRVVRLLIPHAFLALQPAGALCVSP